MNPRIPAVETQLRRVAGRARWFAFGERSAALGTFVATSILLLGLVAHYGWVTSETVVTVVLCVLLGTAFLYWAFQALIILATTANRSALGADLERVNPSLLDRVNTLLHLEPRVEDGRETAIFERVAWQVQEATVRQVPTLPTSSRPLLARGAAFTGALLITLVFFGRYEPFANLEAAAKPQSHAEGASEPPPDLGFPTNTVVEAEKPWGEVRIIEPGRDLVIRKTDIVPLQIEAAANAPLTNLAWRTALNGGEEASHALPPPAEPRYAVYQPQVSAADLRLEDWDVLAYFGQAGTERGDTHRSEIYFLEVQPPSEELEAMRNGGSKQCYNFLNELTALMQDQQKVIRETHRYLGTAGRDERSDIQDRTKIAEAESELAASTDHLKARMEAALGDRPVGDLYPRLKDASRSLESAGNALRTNAVPQAQLSERNALALLSDARKHFRRAIGENPGAFADPAEADRPDENAASRLRQIAEFRDEAKVAREFLADAVRKQQSIADRADANTVRTNYARLAGEELLLRKSLTNFSTQHPELFPRASTNLAQAEAALQAAAQSLLKQSADSRPKTRAATEQLKQLSEEVQRKSAGRELADAHQLKKLLDQQAKALGQCQNPGSSGAGGGGAPSDGQVQQTVAEAKATLQELDRLSGQSPTREQFGDAMREALQDGKRAELERKLGEVAQSQGEGRQRAAGEAKQGLEAVSRAFDQSLPGPLRQAMAGDALQPGGEAAKAEGIRKLQQLADNLQRGDPLPHDEVVRALREVMRLLRLGEAGKGSGRESASVAVLLEEKIKEGEPVDLLRLQQLLDELRKFSVEIAGKEPPVPDKPEAMNIDPQKLPPAYRGRIEKYFQKLSEGAKGTATPR